MVNGSSRQAAIIRQGIAALLAWLPATGLALGQQPAPTLAGPNAQQALAATISRLVEGAIPLEYDKQKDWGATTELAALRAEGRGLHTRLKFRKRPVNHGLWKHYRLKLLQPESNLHVRLAGLQASPRGVQFQLQVDAKLDTWARAKLYQYGVHLIALEIECDMQVTLTIDGDLALEWRTEGAGPAIALTPRVTAAQLQLKEFHLRRVSNAHGPIVRELGEELPRLLEDELNGPKLVEKLNRGIEKKRERLALRPSELWESRWWPLSSDSFQGANPSP